MLLLKTADGRKRHQRVPWSLLHRAVAVYLKTAAVEQVFKGSDTKGRHWLPPIG